MEYNASAPKSNPEKRSKEFTSPANDGGMPYGRTKSPKDPATPKDPLKNFEDRSKESNHQNG